MRRRARADGVAHEDDFPATPLRRRLLIAGLAVATAVTASGLPIVDTMVSVNVVYIASVGASLFGANLKDANLQRQYPGTAALVNNQPRRSTHFHSRYQCSTRLQPGNRPTTRSGIPVRIPGTILGSYSAGGNGRIF